MMCMKSSWIYCIPRTIGSRAKIVWRIQGKVFNATVNFCFGSKVNDEWFVMELNAENNKQCYISQAYAPRYLLRLDVT